MRIKQISRVGTHPVFDITVEGSNSYALENGVVSHNSGLIYIADSVAMLSKSKDKDKDKNIIGTIVTVKMYKSRLSKENSEVQVRIAYNGGLDKYYGLLDMAVEAGMITSSAGKYTFPEGQTPVKVDKISANPEAYFTPKFLQDLDEKYVIPTYSYGVVSPSTTDEDEDSE